MALVNLIAGYGAAMLLAVLVILRRRAFRLLPSVLMTPLYWLLISAAAYRALWQLGRDPFGWEKTEHGLGKRRTPVVTPAGDR